LFGWYKDLQQNLGLLRVETIFNSRNSKLKGIGANNNLSVGGIFHNAHLMIEEFGNIENETRGAASAAFPLARIFTTKQLI
jgi:hypothetical protein